MSSAATSPRRAWHGQAAAVCALALCPLAVALLGLPHGQGLPSATLMVRVATAGLMLIGTLMLHVWWSRDGAGESGWLVASAYVSVGMLAGIALGSTTPGTGADRPSLLASGHLLSALGLLLVAVVARRTSQRLDPLLLGCSTALLTSAIGAGWQRMAAPPSLPVGIVAALFAVTAAVQVAAVIVLIRRTPLPAWPRTAAAAITLLLIVAQLETATGTHHRVTGFLLGLLCLAPAIVFAAVACSLQHRTGHLTSASVHVLEQQLEDVESVVREDRAKLHEIKSTLAGVAAASQLLTAPRHVFDQEQRDRLERTLMAEVARLERLLAVRPAAGTAAVSVDDVLEPVVEAHRLRDHRVEWTSSAPQIRARPDDVAEAVNILLENAARHAGDAGVRVDVTTDGDDVVIAASDSGPGIPQGVQAQMFSWGTRGDQSTGQGIGLYVAKRLITGQGGSLTYDVGDGGGTTFIIRLPGIVQDRESHDRLHQLSR